METEAQTGSQSQAGANQDDRIWAAIAHGSAFFVIFGPIIPVILWFARRKKSAYIAFHALQAMVYQSLFFWTWVVLIPLLVIVMLVIALVAAIARLPDQNTGLLVGLLPQLVMWVTLLGTFVLYVGVGLWGAIACLLGRDFRYPFFGARMARALEYQGVSTALLPEEKEDHVVGAVCHSTLALLLWGLVTPLVVWITQHERSRFLRFQALQATIYQAIGLVGYLAFMILDFVFIFGSMALALSTNGQGSSGAPALLGLASLPFLACLCLFALAGPVYQILGFIAAVRVLNGHDFHYPILGRILASRLEPKEAA